MRKSVIGGQAVIEGVMMKAPKKYAITVRNEQGELVSTFKEHVSITKRVKFWGIPVIRGVANFVEMLVLGMRVMTDAMDMYLGTNKNKADSTNFSEATAVLPSDMVPSDEVSEDKTLDTSINPGESTVIETVIAADDNIKKKKEKGKDKKDEEEFDIPTWVVVPLAIIISVGLFIVLPTFLANLLRPHIGQSIVMNIIEGLIRLLVFLGYLVGVRLMKDIRRVWMYHGAEHKVISCYEHEADLSIENARKFSRLHPRCGTNYMFLVMVISIVFFSLLGWSPNWYLRILSRIILLPIVAGISYEVLKIAAKYDNIVTKIVRAPGLALQRLTTIEPEDDMLEVAIHSFNLVLEDLDEGEAKKYADEINA